MNNMLICNKPFAFTFPVAGVMSFLCLLIYYGVFNTFGPLTSVQREGFVFFFLSNTILLILIPIALYVVFQNVPSCAMGVGIQLGLIFSFIMILVASVQFQEDITPSKMMEYFEIYYKNYAKAPPYLELSQETFQNCCGLSKTGYKDYIKFWMDEQPQAEPSKIFSLSDSCCKIIRPGCATNLDPRQESMFQNKIQAKGCYPLGVQSFPPFYQNLVSALSIIPCFVACQIAILIVIFNIYFCLGRRGYGDLFHNNDNNNNNQNGQNGHGIIIPLEKSLDFDSISKKKNDSSSSTSSNKPFKNVRHSPVSRPNKDNYYYGDENKMRDNNNNFEEEEDLDSSKLKLAPVLTL